MRFTITGSGGCVSLPRPGCRCPVCSQARRLGPPYARCGPSLYLHDAALLVDTPEDIVHALNRCDIPGVDRVLYSHWDPDHTLGMRVFEALRLEWLDHYRGIVCTNPVDVWAEPGVLEDLRGIRSPYGPYLDYYGAMGLIRCLEMTAPLTLGNIRVTAVPVPKEKHVSVFVFEQNGRRLIYAPCDCVPFPDSPLFSGADVLVLGNTFVDDTLKNDEVIGPDHPLRRELFSLAQAADIKRQYHIGRLIITHLEEDWGRSYDDYQAMEKQLDGITFAWDGMTVCL